MRRRASSSAEANGNIVYLNATLAELARPRSRAGRLRRSQARRRRGGRGRGAAHHARGRAGRREDRDPRHRPQDPHRPHRSGAAVPQGRVRRRRRAPDPRARSFSTAPATAASTRSAPPKCASCASSRTPRWRSRPSTSRAGSRARTRCFARLFNPAFKGESPATARSSRSSPSATATRSKPRSGKAAEGQGEIAPVDAALDGAGERFASFYVTAIEDEQERDQEAAIVYALETTAAAHAREPARSAAEDGDDRPARRQHRARLQQPARRHHDGDRLPAERAQADRSVVPGHHADQAERQPGGEPGAAAAGVLAQADACARRCSISARRCPISRVLLQPPDRRERHAQRAAGARPLAGQGRRRTSSSR